MIGKFIPVHTLDDTIFKAKTSRGKKNKFQINAAHVGKLDETTCSRPRDVLSAVLSPNNQRRADTRLCSRLLGFQVPLPGKDCPPEAALYF